MSDYSDVVEAIRDDLLANIPRYNESTIHLYEPWDPEDLSAAVNEGHLAIWPSAEETETAEPLATGTHLFNQLYIVQYWEGASEEGGRVKRNEPAAKRLYDLHNATRARFYLDANQTIGGSVKVWYRGSVLPSALGIVRWFQMRVIVQRAQSFS